MIYGEPTEEEREEIEKKHPTTFILKEREGSE